MPNPKLDYLFTRRSKFYTANIAAWRRILDAYCGGGNYIRKALIQHVAENRLEFAERRRRAIYLNIPRKITDMVCEYIFSTEPDRTGAPEEIVNDFDRAGMTVDEVMRQAEIVNFLFGVAWILVDYPQVAGRVDLETKVRQRIRPYARVLMPHMVKDWAYGSDGNLLWVLIEEHFESKNDPFEPEKSGTRYRLWTREEWYLYERVEFETREVGHGSHQLGRVPVIRWMDANGYKFCSSHWFEDVVRISDAILNEISEAQMNTIKQLFGILVVSETFANCSGENLIDPTPRPGETQEQALVRTAREKESYRFTLSRTSSIFETAEEKGLTRYVAPTGTETAAIISFVQFLQNALNDVLRMALQSSSKSAQTAESKEWDNHNAQQFFAERAGLVESVERKIWELMHEWDRSVPIPKISYSREFSITDISTMVSCLMDLSSFDVSDEFSREVCDKALVLLDKLDRIPQDRYDLIKKQIAQKTFDKMPSMLKVDELINGTQSNLQGEHNEDSGNPPKNRQG